MDNLCEKLNKPKQAVYKLRQAGLLPPAIRVGGSLRWRLSTIEQWLDEQTEPTRTAG
jgi:predicted DNA-binding transcriptional regulator AlpA